MNRKYMAEFESNVCDEDMSTVREAVECVIKHGKEEEYTRLTANKLFCVAEFGLRFLMDIMIEDKESSIESKQLTLQKISEDLYVSRMRINIMFKNISNEIGLTNG